MTETKDVAVLSREEVVQKAIDYCKSSKRPNVVPDTMNLCFGLAGLVLIDAGAEAPTDVLYFPVTDIPGCGGIVEMTSLPMSDRLDISGFFDTYGDNSMVDINKRQSACYLPNIDKKVCSVIPMGILDKFKSTQALVNSLRENNNAFYEGIIKDISDKVFKGKPPAPLKPEVPTKEPTQFPSGPVEKTISDRVDFIAMYDHLVDKKLMCVDSPDGSGDSLVICLGTQSYYRISSFMQSVSLSVRVLLDSMDKGWFVDKDFIK